MGKTHSSAPAPDTGIIADLAKIDAKYGLPAGTLASVWQEESGCGANVGPSHNAKGQLIGACGHFQFMAKTALDIKAKCGHDPLSSDPKEAAQAAGFYLAELKAQFGGNDSMALAAYNAGPGNVHKAVRDSQAKGTNWLDQLTTNIHSNETKKYVHDILGRVGHDVDYKVHAVDADFASRSDYDRRRAAGLTTKDEDDAEYAKRLGTLAGEGVSDEKLNGMSRNSLLGSVFMAIIGLIFNMGAPAFNAMPTPQGDTPITGGTTPTSAPSAPITPTVALTARAPALPSHA